MAQQEPLVSPASTTTLLATATVGSAFALFGLIFGAWQVLLPDLQTALALSEGALGSAITIGFLAAFPVMVFGGWLADRVGPSRLMSGTALLIALASIGLAAVDAYWQLLLLLLAFFGASGAYDVGINAAAIRIEQQQRRRVLPFAHATFSGAAVISALFCGALLAAGISFRSLYLIVAGVALLLAIHFWRQAGAQTLAQTALLPERRRPFSGFTFLGQSAILLLALIAALTSLSEGTVQTWSAIYLRSTLGLPIILGALGPALIHLAMLVGRLLTGYLSRLRFLPRPARAVSIVRPAAMPPVL